ncbi:MAG: glycosyl transferase [Prevotella sp.]|nr:glycosyl transferase [Prevotella sp.]
MHSFVKRNKRTVYKILNWLIPDDKKYLSFNYRMKIGRKLNWNNPQAYTEKVQWLKLNDIVPEYTVMVDKYSVKDYIAQKIGPVYVIPTIGVWENAEDIDFSKLPEQFVLKCSHDSGGLLICKDKAKLNTEAVKKEFSKALKMRFYMEGREYQYKDVVPRVIAEQYIEQEDGGAPWDYKVLCFGGKAKLIEVHAGRYSDKHTQSFYDIDWKQTTISQGGEDTISKIPIPKPACFDEMIEKSEILAQGMRHVRVDWYIVKGQLLFGEITLYDGSGLEPFTKYEDDLLLGSWIDINN